MVANGHPSALLVRFRTQAEFGTAPEINIKSQKRPLLRASNRMGRNIWPIGETSTTLL
jgi:hypothetical protein